MATEGETAGPKKAGKGWMFWTGWVIGGLPAVLLLLGTVHSMLNPADAAKGMAEMGYPESVLMPLSFVVLVCAVLYLIPWTAVLGAILLTGYMGGAVATHVRVEDGLWWIAVIFGALFWLGLYLRDARVRALVPIRWLWS